MLLRRLALLLALEGVVLALIGIAYGVAGMWDDKADKAPTELAAAAAVVTGGILLLLSRATSRRRAWARSPAIVLNVFPIPVAGGLLQAGVWWVGVPMLLVAGTVLYLHATGEVRAAMQERHRPAPRASRR